MNSDELLRENQTLRERLSRLSQASRRINESLDFDTVLQDVVDSARDLAGEPVRVTAVEYDLLRELSIHAGRVLPTSACCSGCGERPSPERPGWSAPTWCGGGASWERTARTPGTYSPNPGSATG